MWVWIMMSSGVKRAQYATGLNRNFMPFTDVISFFSLLRCSYDKNAQFRRRVEIADLFKFPSAQRKPQLRLPRISKAVLTCVEFKHSSFWDWKNSFELPQRICAFYFWGSRLFVGLLHPSFPFPAPVSDLIYVGFCHICIRRVLMPKSDAFEYFSFWTHDMPPSRNISSQIPLNMFILHVSSWQGS